MTTNATTPATMARFTGSPRNSKICRSDSPAASAAMPPSAISLPACKAIVRPVRPTPRPTEPAAPPAKFRALVVKEGAGAPGAAVLVPPNAESVFPAFRWPGGKSAPSGPVRGGAAASVPPRPGTDMSVDGAGRGAGVVSTFLIGVGCGAMEGGGVPGAMPPPPLAAPPV
jgi:hypothetical protein